MNVAWSDGGRRQSARRQPAIFREILVISLAAGAGAAVAVLLHHDATDAAHNTRQQRNAAGAVDRAGVPGGGTVHVITTFVWRCNKGVAAAAVALMMTMAGSAQAQTAPDPNPGAITFTGGFDFPTVYVFRGIVQETDPKLTLWPYGDLGLSLATSDGSVKSVGVNIGLWNSLNTGTSGSDGSASKLHYEEDFYATLSLGFGAGVGLGTTFTAYTSPNFGFNTVKELSFKVTKTHMLAPYGVIAFELGDESSPSFGTADLGTAGAGNKQGTYLELGVGPSFPLGSSKATLAIPVKVGVSLNDYYQLDGVDHKFGFFDIGGLVTLPLSLPSGFGAWNIHGGVDVLTFGDTTRVYNSGDKSKVVGLVGVGVSY